MLIVMSIPMKFSTMLKELHEPQRDRARSNYLSLNGFTTGTTTEENCGIHCQHKTNEMAVMIDTFRPLKLRANLKVIDDKDYPKSWLSSN